MFIASAPGFSNLLEDFNLNVTNKQQVRKIF